MNARTRSSRARTPIWVRVLCALVLAPILLSAVAWAAGAIFFDLPAPYAVRAVLACTWALAAPTALFFARPRHFALVAVVAGFALILGWWLSLEPRQDRDWRPEVAVSPNATVDGERVTIEGVRNFDYRSEDDFTARYDTRTYDLGKLQGLDVFQCYWGNPNMAHPIFSFDFGADGRICFSIETRPERGEGFSTLGGLYRRFELIYIAADERDVVRVRTNFRQGEDVYLYRLHLPHENVRELFLEYVNRIVQLHGQPEFYNVLTHNCTTSVRMQRSAAKRAPFDYRLIVNGKADEMLYERGILDRSLPFDELERRAHVNPRALAAGDAENFSERIRAQTFAH